MLGSRSVDAEQAPRSREAVKDAMVPRRGNSIERVRSKRVMTVSVG